MEESQIALTIGPEDPNAAAARALPEGGMEQSLDADLEDSEDADDGSAEGTDCAKNLCMGEDVGDTGTDTRVAFETNEKPRVGDKKEGKARDSSEFDIVGAEGAWESALARSKVTGVTPDIVSIKAKKRRLDSAGTGSDTRKAPRKTKGKKAMR
jgi:hypothetical protein